MTMMMMIDDDDDNDDDDDDDDDDILGLLRGIWPTGRTPVYSYPVLVIMLSDSCWQYGS